MHLLQVTQADLKLFFESICGEVGHSLLETSFPLRTVCVAYMFAENDNSTSTVSTSTSLASTPVAKSKLDESCDKLFRRGYLKHRGLLHT
jgi:hypothetical protein